MLWAMSFHIENSGDMTCAPVGKPVFMAMIRSNRRDLMATTRRPIKPPQSWRISDTLRGFTNSNQAAVHSTIRS